MKKQMFAVIVLALTGVSSVMAQDVVCTPVDEMDDWSVTLNGDLSMASFFDNDHHEAMKLREIKFFESLPPKTVHYFVGKDGTRADQFAFDFRRMTGTLSLEVSEGSVMGSEVEMKCESVATSLADWEKVKSALDAAGEDGSTTF